MTKGNFFDTELVFLDYTDILELIYKDSVEKREMVHIVSLNPETMVDMFWDKTFRKVVTKARYVIADGSGVVGAVQMIYKTKVPHTTGVDTMELVLKAHNKESLTICLIGGKPKVADSIAKCYRTNPSTTKIIGFTGYNDIFSPKKEEEEEINAIVSSARPRCTFVSFGSPQQELWIDRHSSLFKSSIVMGVGGAFDFLSKNTPRAPMWMRSFHIEWLYRLIRQPWRIRRQWKLFVFVCYVLYYKTRMVFTGK